MCSEPADTAGPAQDGYTCGTAKHSQVKSRELWILDPGFFRRLDPDHSIRLNVDTFFSHTFSYTPHTFSMIQL